MVYVFLENYHEGSRSGILDEIAVDSISYHKVLNAGCPDLFPVGFPVPLANADRFAYPLNCRTPLVQVEDERMDAELWSMEVPTEN